MRCWEWFIQNSSDLGIYSYDRFLEISMLVQYQKSQLHLQSLRQRLRSLELKLDPEISSQEISDSGPTTVDLLVEAQLEAENFRRLWECERLGMQDATRSMADSLVRQSGVISEQKSIIANLRLQLELKHERVDLLDTELGDLKNKISNRDNIISDLTRNLEMREQEISEFRRREDQMKKEQDMILAEIEASGNVDQQRQLLVKKVQGLEEENRVLAEAAALAVEKMENETNDYSATVQRLSLAINEVVVKEIQTRKFIIEVTREFNRTKDLLLEERERNIKELEHNRYILAKTENTLATVNAEIFKYKDRIEYLEDIFAKNDYENQIIVLNNKISELQKEIQNKNSDILDLQDALDNKALDANLKKFRTPAVLLRRREGRETQCVSCLRSLVFSDEVSPVSRPATASMTASTGGQRKQRPQTAVGAMQWRGPS